MGKKRGRQGGDKSLYHRVFHAGVERWIAAYRNGKPMTFEEMFTGLMVYGRPLTVEEAVHVCEALVEMGLVTRARRADDEEGYELTHPRKVSEIAARLPK